MRSANPSFVILLLTVTSAKMPLQKGRYVSNIIVFGAGLVTAMLLGWRNTATNTTTALNGCDPSVLSELYLATVAKSVTGEDCKLVCMCLQIAIRFAHNLG